MARYSLPGAMGIDKRTFDELDTLIRSLRRGSREFQNVMNVTTRLMAHTTQGFALMYMSGPQARSDRGHYAASSFIIPVAIRTGKSRKGWRVRRLAPNAWEVVNEERGAWAVEFGIVAGGGGRPRPILKMSGVATLRFVQRTRLAQRIMGDTFGNLRNNKGQFRSFEHRIRPYMLMMSGRAAMSGPQGRLPG